MEPIRLSALARELGLDWEGGQDPLVTGAAGIESAGPGDLTFAHKKEFEPLLASTQAAAVLVRPGVECPVPSLRAEDPYAVFARVLHRFLTPQERLFPPGIHPTAVIDPTARVAADVAIGPYCYVGPGTRVGKGTALGALVVLAPDVEVGQDCLLHHHVTVREACILGNGVVLHPGVVIGSDGFGYLPGQTGLEKVPQVGRVVVEDAVEIGANSCIDRATTGQTVIGAGTKIDNLVQVAHNVQIGPHCAISAQTGISGSCQVGQGVIMGGQVGLADHVRVCDGAKIGAKSGIFREIPAGQTVFGYPAFEFREAWRLVSLQRRLPELQERVRELERRTAGLAAPGGD
jgi:UDP-3-O-[3-hydroxymyristoyl] glucosamine N-acyltransferase